MWVYLRGWAGVTLRLQSDILGREAKKVEKHWPRSKEPVTFVRPSSIKQKQQMKQNLCCEMTIRLLIDKMVERLLV